MEQHKVQKLISAIQATTEYSVGGIFANAIDILIEEVTDEDRLELKIKEILADFPEVNQEIAEIGNLFEAEEEPEVEESEDDLDIDNVPTDEETEMAGLDDMISSNEPVDDESGADPTEEVEVSSSDQVTIQGLERTLDQIDKNLKKIKELDSNETLDDIYLKELGRKYLTEQELLALGYDKEFSVENSVEAIFESKIENGVYHFDYGKTLKNFKKKITSLSEGKHLFTVAVFDKLKQKLNENADISIQEADVNYTISKIDGIDTEYSITSNKPFDDDMLELLDIKQDFATFPLDNLVSLIALIKNKAVLNADEKYILECDGAFVNLGDEGELDLVNSIDDVETEFMDFEQADTVAKNLNESVMLNIKVTKVVPTIQGYSRVETMFDGNKFFKLNESYSSKGEILMRKGYPVKHVRSDATVNMFESINHKTKNQIKFVEDALFESKLTPISEEEHRVLMADVSTDSSRLYEYKELFESKGKKLTFRKKLIGTKLYESVFVDDINVASKEIGDADAEDIENITDEEMTDEDAMAFVDDNEEAVTTALDTHLGSDDIPATVSIQTSAVPISTADTQLEDGREYKISEDIYLDVNGNVTNFSDGGDNEVLFTKNTVVKFYAEKGVTKDHGVTWYNVSPDSLLTFDKKDPETLVVGQVYTISDLNNSVTAEFIGTHDMEGSLLYEFHDVVGDEFYHLTSNEVIYNVI